MRTVSDLIECLGGNRVVAEVAGVKPSAVSNWKRFGYIPPRLYVKLSGFGRKVGVHVPEGLFREVPDEERISA